MTAGKESRTQPCCALDARGFEREYAIDKEQHQRKHVSANQPKRLLWTILWDLCGGQRAKSAPQGVVWVVWVVWVV